MEKKNGKQQCNLSDKRKIKGNEEEKERKEEWINAFY
jgi:hypothetical protein